MQMLNQVDLHSPVPGRKANFTMTTWLEPRVAVGNHIILKDMPERVWTVDRVGQVQKASDINRGWSNNI